MKTFYTHVAGKTLGSHEAFVHQLIQGGATEVNSPDKSDVVIVFCPIVSRLETDINAALSTTTGKHVGIVLTWIFPHYLLLFLCVCVSNWVTCVVCLHISVRIEASDPGGDAPHLRPKPHCAKQQKSGGDQFCHTHCGLSLP